MKKIMKSNKKILILLLLLGIVIRIIFFTINSIDIHVDEAMTAINAKALAEKGVDIYGTSYPVYLEAWRMGRSECSTCIYD